MADTLYKRLGGYDAIAAVADDLMPRLMADPQLARFWQNRAEDSLRREKQLLVDFLCASSGGPLYYVGRDMKTSHRGWASARATGRLSSFTLTPPLTDLRYRRLSAPKFWGSSTVLSQTSWNNRLFFTRFQRTPSRLLKKSVALAPQA